MESKQGQVSNAEDSAGDNSGCADYDSGWKEAIEVYFEQFLSFFFPSFTTR